MLEKYNYKKVFKNDILKSFLYGFRNLTYNKELLERIFSENQTKVFKKRFLIS